MAPSGFSRSCTVWRQASATRARDPVKPRGADLGGAVAGIRMGRQDVDTAHIFAFTERLD